MKTIPFLLLLLLAITSHLSATESVKTDTSAVDVTGIVTVQSSFSVRKTTANIESGLLAHKFSVKTILDHQYITQNVGPLHPTIDILFGKPEYGHALLQETQIAALFIPLNIAIWQAEDGNVYVTYWDPAKGVAKAITFKSKAALKAIAKMSHEVRSVVDSAIK